MGKRTVYTNITPLPHNIPRQLALDMLHSHSEVIELNPLVTGVRPVEAPRDAASDEFFSQWYEISQIITWGFGIKKKISFKGVFHDLPWGLQTHVYAPMGVDMRNKYRIGGNQPGEPPEARELGLDTPLDGLYLREDVEITCAVPLTTTFVKKEAKAATATMIARLTKKAELLDQGKLHAMFENGRLKTSKPSSTPTYADRPLPSPHSTSTSPTVSSAQSPTLSSITPVTDAQGFGRYHDIVQRQSSQSSHRDSHLRLSSRDSNILPSISEPYPNTHEVQGSTYYTNVIGHQTSSNPAVGHNPNVPQFRAELAGDMDFGSDASVRTQSASYNIQHPSQTNTQRIPPPYPTQDPEKQSLMGNQNGYGAGNLANHPANRTSHESRTSVSDSAARNSQADHEQLDGQSLNSRPPLTQSFGGSGDSQSGTNAVKIIRCPVCHLFDGDAAAVSHHIEKLHFG